MKFILISLLCLIFPNSFAVAQEISDESYKVGSPSPSSSSKCSPSPLTCYLSKSGGYLGTVYNTPMHKVKSKYCPWPRHTCCVYVNNSFNENDVNICLANGYSKATYAAYISLSN